LIAIDKIAAVEFRREPTETGSMVFMTSARWPEFIVVSRELLAEADGIHLQWSPNTGELAFAVENASARYDLVPGEVGDWWPDSELFRLVAGTREADGQPTPDAAEAPHGAPADEARTEREAPAPPDRGPDGQHPPEEARGYQAFLEAKVAAAPRVGLDVTEADVNPRLVPHGRRIVPWMVQGGRRACFAAFGLQKTAIQLEAVRLTIERAGGRGLIVLPLGVRQEFRRDAVERLGWAEPPRFIRSIDEASETGVYLTNYETVRDEKLDPRAFTCVSLDEASVLRGFGGTKTFRQFMRLLAGQAGPRARVHGGVPYRFVATATPSPNDFIELLAYAAYLDVMDVAAAKTRFFKRNSEKADTLTLHEHKAAEFWEWVSTWAVFIQRPSDICEHAREREALREFSEGELAPPCGCDAGYELPPLDVRWHVLAEPEDREVLPDRNGQGRMFTDTTLGVVAAAREKRESLDARIAKLQELRAEDPAEHRLIWHDLEAERLALEADIPGLSTVYGSQDLEAREQAVADFADGRTRELAAKPVMLGSGTNLQRHCARAIFLGIGFKFNDFIQALHRLQRFGQTRPVRVDLIHTQGEASVRRELERKWRQHEELVNQMTALIRRHGLAHRDLAQLTRSMTVQRQEVSGPGWTMVNGDAIEEIRSVASGSVGLIVTSIPFSTQYEYSPSFRDLGHTDSDAHFFEHLGFLTGELLRVLQPGRVAAIHVKDRITPGGITGLGFQTVSAFSDFTRGHFIRHGFAFIGRKTVVTDVVRENNQTYRLGWSEQCKDGSRMGAGLPEYVLLFRRPPTDTSDGYADVPVVKSKKEWLRPDVVHVDGCDPDRGPCDCPELPGRWSDPSGYSRGRWQFDAHGFTRSSGDRPLSAEDLVGLPADQVFKLFRRYSLTYVYDFERDVALADALDSRKNLPPTFMLLQPQSSHPDVWTDIARMRTANMHQAQAGREMHLCPLQFDIADRLIAQLSNPGDLVLDPFAGLGTVPCRALRAGRRGYGIELNPRYWADGAAYCAAQAARVAMPTLFDVTGDSAPEDPTA
jgi:hypothetical protein